MNPHDNAPGTCRTRQHSPVHNGSGKKVEALFAELKNQIGLRRLRLRRMKFVREQFFLAAAAQNIKRLVRFLSQPDSPRCGSYHLAEVRRKNSTAAIIAAKKTFRSRTFSTPTVAVEKLSAGTDLVRAGEVLLSFFSSFLGGESLWCCRWA
jgi:hypothetical protein